ncbi:cellulase family glycosylhydrolase [Deinococcus saxicola]|uniref:cellulase family glycosylhydrolase n=1 Tax=Deinococcus saxicola TaxID=249406 RepID=UPI0039F0A1F6
MTRRGSELRLNGQPYRFAGTNNYYLEYSSPEMVDALLETAAKNKLNVVRAWGFLDIGKSDGSDALEGNGKKNGIYFQSYDGGLLPTINEGEDGLKHLDYMVYKAGQLGIKLVIPFTNNWATFGGMDQYVKWRGGAHHDDFYTDPVIRAWYKWWVFRLMFHKNAYTGVRYVNDPTIMMWELANEPRCKGSGPYEPSANCTPETITRWADEMSGFVKFFDRQHLVGVGDEGFYNSGGSDWTESGGEGIDSIALAKLPNIDVMSAHLYPDHWGKTADWGTDWIERHLKDAKAVGKPFFLGEFGLRDRAARDAVYKTWTGKIEAGGGNDLFWMLADKQEGGTYYPDYDGFTVYCPGTSCTLLSQHAQRQAGQKVTPAPSAADDAVTVTTGQSAVLNVLANDRAAAGQTLNPASLDLDPVAPGIQGSKTDGGGTFTAQPDGSVRFVSSGAGVSFSAAYTVQDTLGQTSNAAAISVEVPGGAAGGSTQTLFSFEDGTQGWAPGTWQTGAGSVTGTTAFHTDGAAGLHVSAQGGGWFGLDLPAPLDLSGKAHLKFDLKTGAAGTSQNVALKVGDSFQWCQLPSWGYVNADTTTTVDVDLNAAFDCGGAGQKPLDVASVRSLYVFFGAGEFDLDNVRAE